MILYLLWFSYVISLQLVWYAVSSIYKTGQTTSSAIIILSLTRISLRTSTRETPS